MCLLRKRRKQHPQRRSFQNVHRLSQGDYGRVLAIGGSDGMAGAISLTGLSALRSGSGLVIVATPQAQQTLVAGFSPCYMTYGCLDKNGHFAKEALDEILERCYWADVVAVGPGMGQSKALQKLWSGYTRNWLSPWSSTPTGSTIWQWLKSISPLTRASACLPASWRISQTDSIQGDGSKPSGRRGH